MLTEQEKYGKYTDSWAYMVGDTWTYGGVNCTDGSQTSAVLIVLIQFVRQHQLIFMVVWILQHVTLMLMLLKMTVLVFMLRCIMIVMEIASMILIWMGYAMNLMMIWN